MARTVADATRFTQTGPYADKPSRTSRLQFSEAPPGETPQEKIKRLREAARSAKLDQISKWDRVVEKGRVWADRSHRFVSLTLIGFTGLTIVYCSAATIDMLSYNRRKRNAFYDQQQAERLEYIKLAQEAEFNGTATERQRELLGAERQREQDRIIREENKITRRIKNAVFGGFSTEEKVGGQLASTLGKIPQPESSMGGVAQEVSEGLGVLKAVEESDSHRHGSIPRPKTGGQLDQLAENTSSALSRTTKSWSSWLTGRS